jgi:AcrR family transcriptional regulator
MGAEEDMMLPAVLMTPDPFQPLAIGGATEAPEKHDETGTDRLLRRRSEILAATRRLLAAHGHDHVTLRQISDECEVTVQTIYNSFGPRLDLLMRALNEHTTAVEAAAYELSSGPSLFLNVADIYCRCAIETPDFLREMVLMLFSTNDSLIQMQQHGTRHKTQLLRQMAQGDVFRDGLQPQMLAAQITRVNAYAVFEWSLHRDVETLRQEIMTGNKLLMLGALQPWAAAEVESHSAGWLSH